MKYLIKLCDKFGLLQSDLDYHLVRGSMVLIFLFFGYQKWFEYEAQALIPYISNGPLISWMYPVRGNLGKVFSPAALTELLNPRFLGSKPNACAAVYARLPRAERSCPCRDNGVRAQYTLRSLLYVAGEPERGDREITFRVYKPDMRGHASARIDRARIPQLLRRIILLETGPRGGECMTLTDWDR
jgi:hypothetical protein